MSKDRKLVFGILALVVGIVAVSITYAAFTQNLNINGTANVQATAWSVHFANLTNGVRTGTTVERTAPTIKSGRTDIGDYAVDFYTPGDSITYTFDVVNDGDYDAKISVLNKGTPQCGGSDSTSNTNVCNNLEYTLTYTTGGQAVAVNDTLRKNETKNMTLVLRYKNTIGQDELPSAEVTVSNLGITIQYMQDSNAGGNPVVGPTYLYSVSTIGQNIGDILTVNNTDVFDNYSAATTAFGYPFFTAHVVNGSDEITESYVGFVLNNTAYYLQGSGATFDDNTGDLITASPYYNTNKATLDTAFGSANCTLYNSGSDNEYYECYDSASGVGANASVSGHVDASAVGTSCIVNSGGDSFCSSGSSE